MIVKSAAKINLALDIVGIEDSTGYHFIQTVFQEIEDLFDEIEVERRGDEILIECDNPKVPKDRLNTMHKAVTILQEKTGIREGVKIILKKNIPLGAGLGGGSSNAAAVLKALNNLWNLSLSARELRNIGAKIGVDVPFFIEGGTAVGRHFGEEIEILPDLKGFSFKVLTPAVSIDTPWAYKEAANFSCGKKADLTEEMIKAIKKRDPWPVLKTIHNDFQEMVFEKFPEVRKAAEQLRKEGFEAVCLSGSGSSVFGVKKILVSGMGSKKI